MDVLLLVLMGCGAAGALLAAVAAVAQPYPGQHPLAAGEARERRDLRLTGQFERGAALELKRRLLDDLRRHEAVRRHLESGEGDRDREVTALLQLVDRSEQTTRHQIAEVEMWLSRDG